MNPVIFEFEASEFNRDLLPIDGRLLEESPELLNSAIVSYLTERFKKLGGTANIVSDQNRFVVTWIPIAAKDESEALDYAVGLLQRGAYGVAEPVLRGLLKRAPTDPALALNLGMMLSDQGRLAEAVQHLQVAVERLPTSADAWNALGVALLRSGDRSGALAALRKSHQIAPNNPYTLKNLGSLLMEEQPTAGASHLKRAAELLPSDQGVRYGYALALQKLGDLTNADLNFKAAIDLAPYTQIAELCRSERSRLATNKTRETGQPRMDVVMYILSALQAFEAHGDELRKALTYEVAMLGRNGLDVNDPAQKYTLKSLPGKFSGLHLLAMMYAGLQVLAPGKDAGVDFSAEYSLAKSMHKRD